MRACVVRVLLSVVVMWNVGASASAQESSEPASVESTKSDDGPRARDASGTSWLPDLSPMYAVHGERGSWRFMGHGNAFVQYLSEQGSRGASQTGSINWIMAMAERPVGVSRLQLRSMFSLEPWTIGGCGYPDLLASGERCDGGKIHDQQHPHDLAMELAATLDVPMAGALRWQGYAGVVGEPAFGPVAFPHRVSAISNPLAPITHHWLDSTHITFGVATVGVYGAKWKIEGSSFNGREPDEHRTDFDLGRLDSYSGRLWLMPTPSIALQVSAGKLRDAEPGEEPGEYIDVKRITASATYHRLVKSDGIWATTVAWGRNEESGEATNGALVETNLTLADRDSIYARFETGEKSGHDLDLPNEHERYDVAKLQAGYTRYFIAARSMKAGLGVSASLSRVPSSISDAYGGRYTSGAGVFVTLRPAGMMHAGGAGHVHGASSEGAATISGVVVSMSGGHVMLRTDDGREAMVMIDAATAVTRGSTPVDASTLQVGERAVVQGTGSLAMLAATSIQVITPAVP